MAMVEIGVVHIPASFETLRDAVGPDRISQVLIESPEDLKAIKRAVAEVDAAGQGKLFFIRGQPGQGKTSLIESAAIFLADVVGSVISAPAEYDVPLADLPRWIADSLPAARQGAGKKLVVVKLDQREIPALDENVTRAAMGNLNGLLRSTPRLLLLWPVNEREFAEQAVSRLTLAGGQTALAMDPIFEMSGLGSDRFYDALRLLLDATNVRLEDAAISVAEAQNLVTEDDTIGGFLRKVQGMVVERYDLGDVGRKLPRLHIVITSNDNTFEPCRLLRRGSNFLVDPDKLLQHSKANVATDWRKAGKQNPRHGLSFISSLFEVRLLNLSNSAVVNAVAFGPDEELRAVVRRHYKKPISMNAANAMRNSSLARALRNEEDVSAGVANPSDATRKAYTAVQKLTNAKHKQINEAICRVLTQDLELRLPDLQFEHKPFSDRGRELRVDAWSSSDQRPIAIEFTHRRDRDASVAVIASYVLNKVKDYARDYGLT